MSDPAATTPALRAVDEGSYAALLDLLPDAVVVHDGRRILHANRAAVVMMGAADAGELIGKNPLDFVHPDCRAVVAERVRRIQEEGWHAELVEERLVRLDGRVIDVETSAVPLRYRGNAALQAVIRDISSRKQAEEALRRSEASLAEAQRVARLGSWDLDLSGVAGEVDFDRGRLSWSDEVFRIFGYEPGAFEASAERFFASVHPEDRQRIREATIESLRECKPYSVEHRIVLPDGTLRVVHERSQVYRDETSGRPVRMIGTVQDVTERKRAEEELARATAAALEASRLKSAFLANMSHEIRTPLNVMLGLSWVVKEHLEQIGDDSQDEYFEGIQRASRRLLRTIDGILDLSKIESRGFEVRPTLVDLRQTIREQIAEFQPLASKKNVALRAEFGVDDAVVLFDEYCLQQALANLLDNALKFTVKGDVSVRLQREEGGAAVIEVEDTGIGIDAGFLPLLWEPFVQEEGGHTRRFEGSGLGLTLVKKYLELNGATIEVRSQKGKGSRFRIRFAGGSAIFSASSRAPRSAPPPGAEIAMERPTLLLVEDDEDTVLYVRKVVGSRFRLLCAANGKAFREQLAAEGRVDLVLMDLSLEGGEDGLELTRWLRAEARFRDIPVVAVTAHALEADQENAVLAGCDDYLAKPVTPRELLAKISEVLRRRTPERSTGGART